MNIDDLLKTINVLKARTNNINYSAPMTNEQRKIITEMNIYCDNKCDLSVNYLIAEDYIIKNLMEYNHKISQEEWWYNGQ